MTALALFFAPLVISLAQPSLNCATHAPGFYVLGIASQMGLNIRWGGDWNQDTKTKDNKFDDLVHFEIKE